MAVKKPKMTKIVTDKSYIPLFVVVFLLVLGTTFAFSKGLKTVHAADNNLTDGITVDSTGDGADANLADSICDDGSGNCTLRAAIQESNNEAGTQTIEFNIAGSGVHTIQPTSVLPSLTDTVIIDGYSQPGAQANTAVAPNPLNGILLIELDGTNAGVGQNSLNIRATDTEIRGLVINRSGNDGINIDGDNVKIYGNYIGSDPTGLIDQGNVGSGVTSGPSTGDAAKIGGSNPSERNIISGNDVGGVGTNANHDAWVVRGNYIGVAADGLTPLGNSGVGGNPSIDDVSDTIVGGPNTADANVISDNSGQVQRLIRLIFNMRLRT